MIRPKYVYGQEFPKLLCDTCWMGSTCPYYHEGHVCAHKKEFKKFKTRQIDEVMEALCANADKNLARLQHALIKETLLGVIGDPVTKLTGRVFRQLSLVFNLHMQIKHSKSVQSPISEKVLEQFLMRVREQQND